MDSRKSLLLRFAAASALAISPILAPTASAQTVANPGFEEDTFTVFPGYSSTNGPVTGWTQSTPSQQGINPSDGSPFANNGVIPEGDQVGFIQTNGNTNTYTNTITGLTVGLDYELSFRVNARGGQLVRMNASVGGEVLQWALVNSVGGANPYGYYVRSFEATAAEMELVIESMSGTDQTLLIDDFQIVPKADSPWSVSAWTNDADSGIDPDGLYTHAYNLGNLNTAVDAVINTIPFNGAGGGNPAVAGSFSLSGPGNDIPNDANNVTGDGGSRTVANTFIYNGNPATLTIEGLSAGQRYRTSLFGVGWDDNTASNRTSTLEARGERISVDESGFNNNNGIRVDYEFVADGDTEVIVVDPLGNNTFHFYGFANLAVDSFWLVADSDEFSSFGQSDLVTTLTAFDNGVEEAASYGFVAGDGDDDNDKFQLVGDEMQVGTYDFNADPNGTSYSVRIGATGNVSGGMAEAVVVVTKSADSDGDGLPDAWELAFAADLTVLSGLDDADADGDDVTDLSEFTANPTADPDGLDPTNPDSDGDDLDDGAELAGTTDPLDPDTDSDGVEDGAEVAAGTDPNNKDSDGDGWRDGLELALGSDAADPNSVPGFEPGFSIGGVITDDCSTGISSLVSYTHAISPGGEVTINGVDLVDMDPAFEPPGIVWEASGGKNEIRTINNNNWVPSLGGVVGPGMLRLLGGFTYSGGGANAGSTQSYTLSGLTAGVTYDCRIYIRPWAVAGVRFIDLTFTNGDEVVTPTPEGGAPEDNVQAVLMNGGSDHQAYFMNFRYTAQGETLVIDANVPATAPANNGSFHLYGLTNEVAANAADFDFAITSISRDGGSGEVTFTFNSQPGVDYAVDFCTTLNPEGQPGGWQELTDSVESMGASTTFTDDIAAPANPPVLFYRVKPIP